MRTKEEQDKLYAQGRTMPGKIVTQAKGGDSMHNYAVAFDICPIVNGKAVWEISLFNKIGKLGMDIGLEWGGSWKKFIDRPHFQYTAGHDLTAFKTNKIDLKKFA